MRQGIEIVDSGVSATSSAPTHRRDTNDLEANFANEIDHEMAAIHDGARARNAAPPFTHVDSKGEAGFADDVSSLQPTVDEAPSTDVEQYAAGGGLSAIQEDDDYPYLRRRNWLIVVMLCVFLALTIAIGAGVGLAVKKSPNGAAGSEDVPSPPLASPLGGELGSSGGAQDAVPPDDLFSNQSPSGEEAAVIDLFEDSAEPTAAPSTSGPTSTAPTSLKVTPFPSPAPIEFSSVEPTGRPTDPVSSMLPLIHGSFMESEKTYMTDALFHLAFCCVA